MSISNDREYRAFEMRASEDGSVVEGYAAVFNTPAVLYLSLIHILVKAYILCHSQEKQISLGRRCFSSRPLYHVDIR